MQKTFHFFSSTAICLLIACIMGGCSPQSKESYLKKYDDFITDVSENYKSHDEKDWKKATEKYEKFSGEWYNKFENEFSLKDQIKIKSNQAKWYYYSKLNNAPSTVKKLFESIDIKGLKQQVQSLIDNNDIDDLKKLYKDAQKEGIDAVKALNEILDELNVNIDELQENGN